MGTEDNLSDPAQRGDPPSLAVQLDGGADEGIQVICGHWSELGLLPALRAFHGLFRRRRLGNDDGLPGLQLVQGPGKHIQMMPLPLHGKGERIRGVFAAFVLSIPNHPGIHGAELFGLAFGDRAQVLQSAPDVSGNPEVVEAVNRLGAGDFLEDLGDLRKPFFQRAVGISVVLQVGQGFTDDGAPQVLFRLGHVGGF